MRRIILVHFHWYGGLRLYLNPEELAGFVNHY